MCLGKMRAKTAASAWERFGPDGVIAMDESANYSGSSTKTFGNLRGNGCLVIARDRLFFEMWTPKRNIEIPLDRIRLVSLEKKYNGRQVFGRQVLVVHFTASDGADASVGFYARDVAAMASALRGAVESEAAR